VKGQIAVTVGASVAAIGLLTFLPSSVTSVAHYPEPNLAAQSCADQIGDELASDPPPEFVVLEACKGVENWESFVFASGAYYIKYSDKVWLGCMKGEECDE